MAATKYTYSIANDTANGKVNPDTLKIEIQASAISIALNNGTEGQISTGGDVLDIWFAAALSAPEQTILTAIVLAHTGFESEAVQEGDAFVYSKTWTEFKAILNANNMYFNYEDVNGVRTITGRRNAQVTYVCKMAIVVSPANGTDQYDFDTNYKSKAGEKTYVYWCEEKSCLAGTTTTHDFKLKNHAGNGSVDVDAFVYKGFISVNSFMARGDMVSVIVIDKDNVLGLGSNVVLGYLIRKLLLDGGAQRIEIDPPNVDFVVNRKRIPAGVYIRVSCTVSGLINPVHLIAGIEYEY